MNDKNEELTVQPVERKIELAGQIIGPIEVKEPQLTDEEKLLLSIFGTTKPNRHQRRSYAAQIRKGRK